MEHPQALCLTVLYRHIYAVKGTILSHLSRPKVTLRTIAMVNELDVGTPSCTQPSKPFSIVSMQYTAFPCIKCENISKKAKNGPGEVLWLSVDDIQ